MENLKSITKKIDYLQKEIKKIIGVEIIAESPKEAYIQAVLARANRNIGKCILKSHQLGGVKNFKVFKCSLTEEKYCIVNLLKLKYYLGIILILGLLCGLF